MPPADLVVVGKVIDAWGLKGAIKVQPYSDEPRALLESRAWWLALEDGTRDFEVYSARMHGQVVTAQLVGLVDRSAAEQMKGAAVSVPRCKFPGLAPSEYYWVDLIGLAVVNPQGDALGQVVGLLDHSAHPILQVQALEAASASSKPEVRLIPFVAAIVLDVDLAARRVLVDWQLDY